MRAYTAYGVGIKSEFTFGALPVFQDKPSITFDVKRILSLPEPPADLTKLCQSQGRNIYVVVGDSSVSVRIGSFLSFEFWPQSDHICCQALEIVPDELLRYWMVQQILPMFLLWNGTAEFLHGMAVSATKADLPLAGSQSIGFLGDSHAGKSTLLSYFLTRGHVLVSDDHLAVSRKNYLDVLPATPYYRPYRAGEDLGLVASLFSPKPAPLKCLFLLEPTLAYADVAIEELRGLTAVGALLPHIQYNLHNAEVPQLFPLVEERFRGLNQLVRQVTIKRLYVPRDLNRLPQVYDFIQKELAS